MAIFLFSPYNNSGSGEEHNVSLSTCETFRLSKFPYQHNGWSADDCKYGFSQELPHPIIPQRFINTFFKVILRTDRGIH